MALKCSEARLAAVKADKRKGRRRAARGDAFAEGTGADISYISMPYFGPYPSCYNPSGSCGVVDGADHGGAGAWRQAIRCWQRARASVLRADVVRVRVQFVLADLCLAGLYVGLVKAVAMMAAEVEMAEVAEAEVAAAAEEEGGMAAKASAAVVPEGNDSSARPGTPSSRSYHHALATSRQPPDNLKTTSRQRQPGSRYYNCLKESEHFLPLNSFT
ncbi:unnamed protein product [Tilletia caries]|nr:unnamed protein product [Tilletia caries]